MAGKLLPGVFQLGGNVDVHIREADGRIRQSRTANMMTSGGLSLIRDYLMQSDASAAPNAPLFIAVGSGTVPIGRFMTSVPGEYYREPIVQRDRAGLAAVYHAYFSSAAATQLYPDVLEAEALAGANIPVSSIVAVVAGNTGMTIGAYGLYAGNPSDIIGTGTLVAIAKEPVPFNKNTAISFNIDWSISISGQY